MKALPSFLALTLAAFGLLGCVGNDTLVSNFIQTYDYDTVVLNTSTSVTPNRTVVQITNDTAAPINIALSVTGSANFALQPTLSCGAITSTLPVGSTCIAVVAFTPTAAGTYSAQLNIASSSTTDTQFNRSVKLNGSAVTLTSGQSLVQSTDNPQVALYSWYPPAAGNVAVSFTSAAEGTHTTATVPATGNAPITMYVAGMLQSSAYTLQAQLTPASGSTIADTAHSFTTGAWPAAYAPQLTAVTAAGQTPSPGIELMNETDTTVANPLPVYAIDLKGNLLWAYNMQDIDPLTIVQSPRQLPNGDFLILQGPASQDVLTSTNFTVNDIREIDFGGNLVRNMTVGALNAKLAAAGYANLNLQTLHHEIQILPNGHILLFGNIFKSISNLTGYTAPVNVLGDVVLDLDANWNPVWVWNSFDYLDPNYHPAASAFPDWTHCNAIQYESNDGNLILSCRHLSWLIKINYANGTGSGAVLWRVGNNGDFNLTNGTTPLNWQYAQHYFHIISTANAVAFDATMIDNGDYRFNNAGVQVCQGQAAAGSDCYTTLPVYHIDENARTVTVLWRNTLPAANFSFFGGEAQQLANTDLEFTLSTQPNNTSTTTEYTYNAAMTQVWQLTVSNQQSYRGGRAPGLYFNTSW